MKRILLAVFGAAVLTLDLQAAKAQKTKKPEPFGDDLLVQVKSTLDGTLQPCWFWAPEKAKTEAVPLIVGLHTWSADYTYKSHYATALNYAKDHGWAMVGPNFRPCRISLTPSTTRRGRSRSMPRACTSSVARAAGT